ncbi:MAG: glycosyltransferase family 4 protein [Lachnospiraceae bacterium]|nr:glycosyltransferase family 4 protein [Lachnospiraceae bacterium]
MEKKRVVLIGNHQITIYNFRREFIQRLVEEGYEVFIILPVTDEAEKLRVLGCQVINVPVDRRGMNPFKDIRQFRSYKKILRELKPLMVFTYTIKPNIYGGLACRILKIPYACTITGLGKAIEGGGPIRSFILGMYKVALKKAQRVFFQNEANKKIFEEKNIGQKRYAMVKGSGVNLKEFSMQEYPGESDPIRFIWVARVTKMKGIDVFLEAAERIKKKYPDTEFQILGFLEEDYEEKITEYAEKKIIDYQGMQKDVISYLAKSQCLVLPSEAEGMSNACLEAAATGRALIASNIPGCKECLDDGVTGYLINPGDSADLVEKIEKFISLPYNEKKHMGVMGRKKMEEEFSREYVIDVYMKELQG